MKPTTSPKPGWTNTTTPPPTERGSSRYRTSERFRSEAEKGGERRSPPGLRNGGDDESVNEIWASMNAAAKKLWRKDGGRDVKASKHPRTRAQRLFDAAHHKLTNTSPDDRSGTAAGSTSGAKASPGTTLFLWQNLDDFVARKHNATTANGQLISQAVLSRHMCGGSIAGIVFDTNGDVLWAGRETTTPTTNEDPSDPGGAGRLQQRLSTTRCDHHLCSDLSARASSRSSSRSSIELTSAKCAPSDKCVIAVVSTTRN